MIFCASVKDMNSTENPKHEHLKEYMLPRVPLNERTWMRCMYAVGINGLELDFVPNKVKIKLICHIAVQQNGMALAFVPVDIRNKSICKKALLQNKEAIEYVPTHIIDEIVDDDWKMIEYIPTRFQNHILLLKYVKKLLRIPMD